MADAGGSRPEIVDDTVLSWCGAHALAALLANDGIVALEVDPPTDTLFVRFDPRRTSQERVEAMAKVLRPALQHTQIRARRTQAPPAGGRLDGASRLRPGTATQRIGRIHVEPAAATPLPSQPVGPGAEAEQPKRDQGQAFLLQVVQPGLVGLMDGSVSTLAPIFATAYATHNHTTAFLVGLASALGAGISMGFAEALSDNGVLTGRGLPVVRGAITGGMTFVGGVGHSLPFLIPNLRIALILAYIVVAIELIAISLIRTKYFSAPFVVSAIQVIVGGALVFAAGVLIGSA